jgi:hypothetical protein
MEQARSSSRVAVLMIMAAAIAADDLVRNDP